MPKQSRSTKKKWDTFVRTQLPDDAMWYPVIISEWSLEHLSPVKPGKNRNTQLAKRLKKLSNLVGLKYKSPHKYRHGHAVYALLQAKNMADYKAISQNLMHGSIKVTDSIYAWLNNHLMKDRITGLSTPSLRQVKTNPHLDSFISQLSRSDLIQAIQKSIEMLAT